MKLFSYSTFLSLLALGLISSIAVAANQDTERRVNDLLSRMTLEEKLGQMSQTGFPVALTDKIKDELRAGRWGSFYGQCSAELKAQVQQIALNESRLKIPLIFGADLIHGFRTTFPIPLGESSSWNPELIQRAAHVTADEAAQEGIHWTFAPMMDIGRDPRWGRIAETLGEDPYLSGVLAAAMVHGFQGTSLSDADSIAACGKHYVGYGAAEGGRDYNTTWIPEPLLRDVYLAPFLAAKNAGIASFMSAFNDLNGIPTSANPFTLRRVLRDEWKFDGVVVSDYEAVKELIPHGYAADERDAAQKAITAGVNMEMVSRSYYENGKALIAANQLNPKLVDEAVRNILRLKLRLGLFGDKGARTPGERAAPTPETLEVARQLAEQSLVLLQNDSSILPLSKSTQKIAVIGPLADSPRDQLGSWTADGESPSITPLVAFRKLLGTERVAYAAGLQRCRDESHDGFATALEAARSADVVILFLGEDADMSGEASSRAFLTFPGAQEELATEVAKAGKPMIAVIMAGRPLTFHDLAQKMSAVLWAWHPGSMGGPAIVDTLLGNNIPSGKLTVTFPRTVGQVPIYYNHMNTGRPADVLASTPDEHFSSKYIDVSFTPEYPFGYGLSYTQFEYSDPKLSDPQLKLGTTLTVSADVSNTGDFEADETAQLYIRQLSASLTQPVRELKAFSRVHLKSGEKKRVTFSLSTDQLAFHNANGKLVTEPGEFQVWISGDSASGKAASFHEIK